MQLRAVTLAAHLEEVDDIVKRKQQRRGSSLGGSPGPPTACSSQVAPCAEGYTQCAAVAIIHRGPVGPSWVREVKHVPVSRLC